MRPSRTGTNRSVLVTELGPGGIASHPSDRAAWAATSRLATSDRSWERRLEALKIRTIHLTRGSIFSGSTGSSAKGPESLQDIEGVGIGGCDPAKQFPSPRQVAGAL